jgi:type VI protein secretion system component VasK
MTNRKPRNGLVGITLYLPLETLTKIEKMEGKALSQKLRTLIEIGLSQATHHTKG